MSAEHNKVRVRQLFAALNKGSEAMEATRPAIFAPDHVAHFAGQRLDYDAHVKYDTMVFSAFADIQYTLNDLLAEGDRVVARFTARGTHTGIFRRCGARLLSSMDRSSVHRCRTPARTLQWRISRRSPPTSLALAWHQESPPSADPNVR